MNGPDDPYRFLGLEQSATIEEIHAAYRKQAKKYHPDHGGDAWAFVQVQDAYERILKERQSNRRAADSQPTAQPEPGPEMKPSQVDDRIPTWLKIVAGTVAAVSLAVWMIGMSTMLWAFSAISLLGAIACIAFSTLGTDNREEKLGGYRGAGIAVVITLAFAFVAHATSATDPTPVPHSMPPQYVPETSVSGPTIPPPQRPSQPSSYRSMPRFGLIGAVIGFIYEKTGLLGFIVIIVGVGYALAIDSKKRQKGH